MSAVGKMEVAHAAYGVAGQSVLDVAVADERMPFRHAVEIADQCPDLFDRRIDNVTHIDPGHDNLPDCINAFAVRPPTSAAPTTASCCTASCATPQESGRFPHAGSDCAAAHQGSTLVRWQNP